MPYTINMAKCHKYHLYRDVMSCTIFIMSMYFFSTSTPLRFMTCLATKIALVKSYSFIPCDPPQEKEGIKFLGKPDPKILQLTPTVVPVLNEVFIAHLE